MNIFVYSDESGVFDKVHNDYYVFGGLIIIGNESKDDWIHKYAKVENTIRKIEEIPVPTEIKSTSVSNKSKGKIFRSLNNCHKFGCVIYEKEVLSDIWDDKKDKQRYLDYAYKIGVKRAFENLIKNRIINPDEVERLYFDIDEHTTATNGKYELEESLRQEFKRGTYNANFSVYFPPIFTKLKVCQVDFCNSAAPNKKLVRASDFIANRIYYLVCTNQWEKLKEIPNLHITKQP